MCTEEQHGLNSSPHLIPMIKLMKMSWVGHRAFTREMGYTEVYSRAIQPVACQVVLCSQQQHL